MDELPPDVRALLERAARADEPTPERKARADEAVREALAANGLPDLPPLNPQTAPPLASGAGATVAPKRWFGRGVSVGKLGLSVAVLGALSLGGMFALRASQPAPASPSAPSSPPAAALQPVPSSPELAPARSEAATPPAKGEVPGDVATHRPGPKPARGGGHGAAPSLGEELRFVAEVDSHVRAGRFERALALLDGEAHRFRGGELSDERRGLRVLALCGRDPSPLALREGERFLRVTPSSVIAARVRSACAAPAGTP